MRRIVGFVLLGLGVFAVALGLLLRLYAYPQLAKVPLDPKTVSVATGNDVTALVIVTTADSTPSPEIRSGLNLTANRYVTGDLTQPEVTEGGTVVSWIEAVDLVDQDGNRVKATERQLCLDRHTNEAVEPCNLRYVKARTNEDFEAVREEDVPQPGGNFKFPFGTEKRTYAMYDLTVRAATDARFDGEEEVDGLATYRFVQDIPATKVEERTVPGSLVGSTEPAIKVDLYYNTRRTMWVEPVTGQIVRGQEAQHQELVEPGQQPGQGTVVFDGTLTFTDETVAQNVADATANKSKLFLLTDLPIYLWIGGGVLIVLGLVLAIRANREPRRGVVHRSPEDDRQPTPA
ncbi:MAG TPA: DUF3068 domain-containing protein [Actinophytocola sp.]|uniref:DUF3068 domain-containing protein n=1 Tax=Actinophytocola sp. TaxID=1872138 RepID=UPI002DB6AA39|nr:DUF3068 domain-containing protein [Actinophytocola sp.]HEU5475406.1 DUF3068 domain-containing protein [Actinophytocola sp.]